jgi:predicted lipid carrier protein YhbT
MQSMAPIPKAPFWMKAAALVTPVALPERLLVGVAKGIRDRRAGILDRVGQHADAAIAIVPSDLPLVFRIQASAPDPVAVLRARDAYRWDARVTAPFFNLLAMLHGVQDGDALFFSRDLVIEGDMSAVLAFRNALDAEELDLTDELLALVGLKGPAGKFLKRVLVEIGHRSGLPVTRAAVAA